MKPRQDWDQMREGIIGLGEESSRRSFYPELRARVSELERAQEGLRRSEANLRSLFNSLNDGVIIHDTEGRVLEVNDAMLAMYGVSREAARTFSILDYSGRSEDGRPDAGGMREQMERLARDGQTVFQWRARRPLRADEFDVEIALHRVHWYDQDAVVAVVRDISSRRQAETALRRLNRELRAISTCNQTLMRTEDEQTLLGDICRIVCEEAGYQTAWVGFAEHDAAQSIRPVAWAGIDSALVHQVHLTWEEAGPSLAGGVIRSGTTLCVQDLAASAIGAHWKDLALRHGYRSLLCLPLRDRDETTFGILSIYSDEIGVFSAGEIRLLEELAGDLAFGILVLRARIEQKGVEAALREREQQHSAMISAIPDLLFVLSRDGEYLGFHASDPSLFFVPPETLVHRKVRDLLPAELAERLMQVIHAALDTRQLQEIDYELEVLGGARTFEARLVPYAKDEVLTLVRDVTEKQRLQQQQQQLQDQLQQTQKMESLGSLAGGIAHDMNNVLGAILAQATTHLVLEPPDSPARQGFDKIAQAATRGGKMVKGLLSFARQSPPEEREVDLNALLMDQAQLLEHTTLARIRLELQLAPDLLPVRGDASALTHAFMNLCVNAVDAMPEQGTLTFRTRNRDADWVEVQVEDTGCGMTEEVLAKALDPFFTTKPLGRGTGLGLAMVYSTITAHHGRIELHSEPGRGTRVDLTLPVWHRPALEPGPAAHAPASAARAALRVLLVDDDELIRDSVGILLEALGHRVTAVASGEQSLRELEAGPVPDLVILDMNMPGLGGIGTLARLRVLHPGLPVLVATGRVDQDALHLVQAYPRVALLAKPFGLAELKQQLDRSWT